MKKSSAVTPQYYAASKLYRNIKAHNRQEGDGMGGTCFGATDCTDLGDPLSSLLVKNAGGVTALSGECYQQKAGILPTAR